MSTPFLNALILAGAILSGDNESLSVDSESLKYYDPPTLSWWPSYSPFSCIARNQQEKVLLWNSDTTQYVMRATSLLALVNVPYSQVKQAIRDIIEVSLDIGQEHESVMTDIPKPETEHPPYIGAEVGNWPETGSGLTCLGKGLSFPKPLEYEITSRPYNNIDSIDGFSVLRLRVIEAKGLLDKEATIIELRRRDYCRDWALAGHSIHIAIPLPWKESRAFTIITEKEVALIERLSTKFDEISIRYFVPSPMSIGSMTNTVLLF